MLKVMMLPYPKAQLKGVSGIHTVINAYDRLMPEYGIEFVHPDAKCDLVAMHAGMGNVPCEVSMLHGLYFTGDYRASKNEWRANAHVIGSARRALLVTVPSEWVAETLRREFRIDPIILPHGIFPDEWKHNFKHNPRTVLWAKNRDYDVCDPTPINAVARVMPDFTFFTTIAANDAPSNVVEIGLQNSVNIKKWIQKVSIVISTVKETWGILYAEALASGTPVVTANYGHVPELVEHGKSGYVYNKNSMDDLEYGLRWTDRHRKILSGNAVVRAKQLDWNLSAERVANVFKMAYKMRLEEA